MSAVKRGACALYEAHHPTFLALSDGASITQCHLVKRSEPGVGPGAERIGVLGVRVFDWVIVPVASFRDAGVGAFASPVGDAFKDLADDFCNGFLKCAGGKMPPGWLPGGE
jgi:hypothetical protein